MLPRTSTAASPGIIYNYVESSFNADQTLVDGIWGKRHIVTTIEALAAQST
jgi:hypothetical protein